MVPFCPVDLRLDLNRFSIKGGLRKTSKSCFWEFGSLLSLSEMKGKEMKTIAREGTNRNEKKRPDNNGN